METDFAMRGESEREKLLAVISANHRDLVLGDLAPNEADFKAIEMLTPGRQTLCERVFRKRHAKKCRKGD